MDGQIIKRGERAWLVRIFLGRDDNGKQRFHHKTIHGTKRDAERYLVAVRREMGLGVFVEPSAISVNHYLDRWLRDAARPRVSRRTADGYAGLLERYIRQPLGHKQLDKLQVLDIQKVYGEMQARGLSARIVRHKKSWSFEKPKTARSRRTVYLSAPLLQKLAMHKRKQAAERLKLGALWQAFDLVFCSDQGTPLSIHNLTYRYFRPILEKAEMPQIRLYDLRHSCATLLLIAEENPKVFSERLGHSTIVLTLDTYSHVLPTMQQGATARLEKLLYKKGGAKSSLA